MKNNCELIQGNCLEKMKEIPAKSIDLIVTDPPFNFHTGGGGIAAKRKIYSRIEKSFGSSFNPDAFLKTVPGIMKKVNMFVYCNKTLLRTYLDFAENNKLIWDILVWNKPNPIPSHYNHFVSDVEYCVYIREKGVCFNNRLKLNFYRKVHTFCSPAFNGHPTPKPLELMERHISLASKKQETVLDPFMGSGTTGIAAIKLKRNFIGIELDKKFFEMAKEKINPWKHQTRLGDSE